MRAAASRLRVVDADTGEVVEGGCPACAHKDDEVAGLKATVTKLGAQIQRMKRDEEHERQIHPHRTAIEDIHRFWQDATGRTGSLGAKRFDAIAAMLTLELKDGESDWKIRMGIIGAAIAANRSESTGEKFDDVELVCRDETKLDSFARRAYLWGERVRRTA